MQARLSGMERGAGFSLGHSSRGPFAKAFRRCIIFSFRKSKERLQTSLTFDMFYRTRFL